MAENRKHLLHIKSNVVNENGAKLPTEDILEYGEIAVNYAEGHETLSIKNSNNEIAVFTNEVQIGGGTPDATSPIELFVDESEEPLDVTLVTKEELEEETAERKESDEELQSDIDEKVRWHNSQKEGEYGSSSIIVDEDEEPLDVTLATKDELEAETTAREEADEEIEEKLDEKVRWYNSSKTPQYDSSEIVIDEDDDFTIDLYTKEEVDEKLNEIETDIDDKLDNLGNVLRGNETENVPTTVLVDEDASADISVYTTDQVDAKLEDMETEFDDKLENLDNVLRGSETDNESTTILVDETEDEPFSVYSTEQCDDLFLTKNSASEQYYTKEETDSKLSSCITSVSAEGQSPLVLEAQKDEGELKITGHIENSFIEIDSLESVPVDYDFVVVNDSETSTFNLSSVPSAGKRFDVFIKNTGDSMVFVEFPSEYIIAGSDHELIIGHNENAVVSVNSDGTNVYLHMIGGSEIPNAKLDIVLYDSRFDRNEVIASNRWNVEDYDTSRYTPIGIVVIPSEHDVYGTGEAGVLSLVNMSLTNPDNGTFTAESFCFGLYGTSIDLPLFSTVAYCGYCDEPSETITGESSTARLASDNFNGTVCPTDTNTFYHETMGSSDPAAPSPYLTDGSRNPLYSSTESPTSSSNCLSDFNGQSNTETLLSLATSQSDWKTADTITENSGAGYCPPVCACWRYHTDGTSQGDWYLPSCGELGYVVARIKDIDDTITCLNDAYGEVGTFVSTTVQHWSSTIVTRSTQTRTVLARTGGVNQPQRTVSHHVRAMMRITAE